MQNFSIIIPTLNEAENITPLLQRLSTMAKILDLSPEIIFVDDGSTDSTCAQISSYQGNLKVRLHQRVGVKGLSGAVVTGSRLASYEDVVIMDGDLSHPPEIIPQLVRPLLAGEKDMVIGSRYTEGGSTPDWPIKRVISSRLATLPAHLLTGIEDPLAGFFSVKRKYLAGLDPNEPGFKIGFELLSAYGNELRTAEVPIKFTDRFKGKSKMRFPILIHYFFQLLKGYGVERQVLLRPSVLLIGCIAALFDVGLFDLLLKRNVDITTSHMVSFFASMHLSLFLGTQALPEMKQLASLLRCYRHLLLISFLMLFLRGGILSVLQSHQAAQGTTLFFFGLFTFCVWLLFAVTLSSTIKTLRSKPLIRSFTVLIIIYSLLLRLVYLGTTELLQEEAYYWYYSRYLSPGYLDHPPLVALLIWIGTSILGHTEAGVRLGAYFCWFGTAYFSYALTRSMFNAKAAINSILLIGILPVFFGSALMMTPDAPLMTCWAATLYFLYMALCRGYRLSWLGAGVFFGIGLASKYTIALLAPAALFFMLVDPVARRWLKSPMPYLAAIVALVFFSPVIWWNMDNNWASFLFQSHGRIIDEKMFTTHRLVASMVVLLTPLGLASAMYALYPPKIKKEKQEAITAGVIRRYRFALIMTLTPLLVFVLFSFTKEVKFNWTGPLWLVLVPFIASSILNHQSKAEGRKSRFFAKGWSGTFFSLIVIYGLGLHYLSIGVPGIPYVKNNILLGWDDLARQVNEIVLKYEKSNGRKPIVVGMDRYRIASGLAFYSNKEKSINTPSATTELPQITGRHLLELKAVMFPYWHPSVIFAGQDLLVIDQSRIGLHTDYYINKAAKVSNIEEISVVKRGKVVAKYYYRLISNYRPPLQKDVILSSNMGSGTNRIEQKK